MVLCFIAPRTSRPSGRSVHDGTGFLDGCMGALAPQDFVLNRATARKGRHADTWNEEGTCYMGEPWPRGTYGAFLPCRRCWVQIPLWETFCASLILRTNPSEDTVKPGNEDRCPNRSVRPWVLFPVKFRWKFPEGVLKSLQLYDMIIALKPEPEHSYSHAFICEEYKDLGIPPKVFQLRLYVPL